MRFGKEVKEFLFQRHSVQDINPREIVRVRGEDEILATLEEDGTSEGLLFIREMRKYCGRKFRVLKCFNKLFMEGVGDRRIKKAVILEGVTCDGKAHGECQRTCVLLWKDAWLEKAPKEGILAKPTGVVSSRTITANEKETGGFSCQLTNLSRATSRLPISFENFVRQYLCNNNLPFKAFERICAFLLWFNFKVQRFLGRKKYATLYGVLEKTPTVALNLQPGELIEIRSKEDILATLDFRGRNRGLSFTAEMLKYCNERHLVLKRVDKMIVEKTGKIQQIRNTVILEGVICDGSDHSKCPRTCYCLWREIWLRRA